MSRMGLVTSSIILRLLEITLGEMGNVTRKSANQRYDLHDLGISSIRKAFNQKTRRNVHLAMCYSSAVSTPDEFTKQSCF